MMMVLENQEFSVKFKKQLSCLALLTFCAAIAISVTSADLSYADSSESGIVQPVGTPSTDLPSIGGASAQSASSPSSPPDNLSGLSQDLTKSVVTVACATGDDLGSGWSANVALTPSMKAAGYRSYIITNLHVVAACTADPSIQMRLSNGNIINGKVWAWSDTDHDVAGIVTDAYVPPLTWRGTIPQQGWWVGVLGSPLGHPGILTTGIVSSISLANGGTGSSLPYSGTTSAPINHGNSGGPVFDRSGRVLGLATAIFTDSQNFGIFNGTPILCDGVINCPSQDSVWGNGELPGTGSANIYIFLAIGLIVIGGLIAAAIFAAKNQRNKPRGPRPQNSYGMTTTFTQSTTIPTRPGNGPPAPPGAPPAPPRGY